MRCLNVTQPVIHHLGIFLSLFEGTLLFTLFVAGLRRRGVTPHAINSFCKEIGITRNENMIHMHKLEHHIRTDLDATSPRILAVLQPLKVG